VTWNKPVRKTWRRSDTGLHFRSRNTRSCKALRLSGGWAFAGPSPAQQLSDHLGLEAVVRFSPAAGLAGLEGTNCSAHPPNPSGRHPPIQLSHDESEGDEHRDGNA